MEPTYRRVYWGLTVSEGGVHDHHGREHGSKQAGMALDITATAESLRSDGRERKLIMI